MGVKLMTFQIDRLDTTTTELWRTHGGQTRVLCVAHVLPYCKAQYVEMINVNRWSVKWWHIKWNKWRSVLWKVMGFDSRWGTQKSDSTWELFFVISLYPKLTSSVQWNVKRYSFSRNPSYSTKLKNPPSSIAHLWWGTYRNLEEIHTRLRLQANVYDICEMLNFAIKSFTM